MKIDLNGSILRRESGSNIQHGSTKRTSWLHSPNHDFQPLIYETHLLFLQLLMSWKSNFRITKFRVGLTRISSHLPVSDLGEWRHICHCFRWQKMWRVTFLGRMWRSRTRKYFFKLVTFFVKSFPKNVTFGPRSVTPRPDVFYQRAVSLAIPSTITTTVNRQTQETSLPDR